VKVIDNDNAGYGDEGALRHREARRGLDGLIALRQRPRGLF
jgi:hypothetical protein